MPRTHPKPEILSGLLELLPEARSRLLRHVRACPSCRETLAVKTPAEAGAALLAPPGSDGRPRRGPRADGVPPAHPGRGAGARRGAGPAPGAATPPAGAPGAAGAQQPALPQSPPLRPAPPTRLPGSAGDPREGERLAMLALALVESLDPSWYGEQVLADARGRCWMIAGNARGSPPTSGERSRRCARRRPISAGGPGICWSRPSFTPTRRACGGPSGGSTRRRACSGAPSPSFCGPASPAARPSRSSVSPSSSSTAASRSRRSSPGSGSVKRPEAAHPRRPPPSLSAPRRRAARPPRPPAARTPRR